MGLLKLLVGNDNSDDGNHVIPILLEVYDQKAADFSRAFARGSEKLGFNLIDDEDFANSRHVSIKHIKLLFNCGMPPKLFEKLFGEEFVEFDDDGDPIEDDDYDYYITNIDGYVKLWLWIATLGSPTLMYDLLETDYVHIGGDAFIEYD